MSSPSVPSPAQPATKRAIVGRAVLWLVIILYFFRFAEYDWGMIPTFSPVGDCLMRGEHLATCRHSFPYPPLFALLMVPLTYFPMWARNVIWYAVLVGATYGCFRICEMLAVRAFQVAREELFWLRLFAVVLSLKFILSVFENQAYDSLVFLFILVGVLGLAQNRSFNAAAGFAGAIALKPAPALMLVYALGLRKWKVFALAVGVWFALSILPDLFFTPNRPGPGYLQTWILEVVIGGLTGTAPDAYYPLMKHVAILNQSLKGLVFNLLHEQPDGEATPHARAILYSVYLVYVLIAVGVILLAARLGSALVWGTSVVLISMLLLSPVSSKSHFVVLLFPHMAIVAYLIRHRDAWPSVLPILGGSFVLNTLSSKLFLGKHLSNDLLAHGCITVGTLLLLAAVALIVLHSRRAARSQ